MRVDLTRRFEERLEEILTFLKERYGEAVAKRAFVEILAGARGLEQFPRKGRMVPEIGVDDIREVIVMKKYRVIYRVRDDVGIVQLLTVRHGKQHLDLGERADD